MDTHPSHKTRFSDSPFYDLVCDGCGASDAAGDNRLGLPCPNAPGGKPLVKTVKVMMKHDDRAVMTLSGHDRQELFDHDGYLPEMGLFGGDTTELEIDNDTGQIVGWKRVELPEGDG